MIVFMKKLGYYLMKFNLEEIWDYKINNNKVKNQISHLLIKRVIKLLPIYNQIKKAIAEIELLVLIMEQIVGKPKSIALQKIEISKNFKDQHLKMLKNLQIMILNFSKSRILYQETQNLQVIDLLI